MSLPVAAWRNSTRHLEGIARQPSVRLHLIESGDHTALVTNGAVQSGPMQHRHLTHSEWTLAAVDDAIARGRLRAGRTCATPRSVRYACASESCECARPVSPIRPSSGTTSGITMSANTWPEWEHVLSAAAHLQVVLPGATLVPGTAAAVFAGHRISYDADHVLADLRDRFDEVLAQLESVAGWRTARVKRPVLILGSLDGIETGVRRLIRDQPLDTRDINVGGVCLVVPTEPEMLRIKAVLILKRNATRDYLDFVALAERLGPDGVFGAVAADIFRRL